MPKPIQFFRASQVVEDLPVTESLHTSRAGKIRMRAAQRIQLRRPEFLVGLSDPEADRRSFFDISHLDHPDLWAVVVDDAMTLGECLVLLPDGRFFEAGLFSGLGEIRRTYSSDSLTAVGGNHYESAFLDHPPYEVSQPTVFLGGRWFHFYKHWVFDVLTKLVLLDEQDVARFCFALPEGLPPPFVELVRAFGIPDDRFVWLSRERPVLFHRLIILPQVGSAEVMLREAFDHVRDVVLRTVPKIDDLPEKVLVTRRDAPSVGRQLANEELVIETLMKRGYKAIVPGKMTLPEQAALFFHARNIVAVHGGGTVNVIFCSDDAAVMHLHPADAATKRSFGQVSGVRQQPFGYVFGDCFSHPRRGQGVEWVLDLELLADTAVRHGF